MAEADESDGSFLKLTPTIAVVTTIDAEHLDYYRDLAAIRETFLQFINKVPFYGVAVLCADQPEIQALRPRVEKRVVTYGPTAPADLVAASVHLEGLTARFEVLHRGESLGELRLQVPGADRRQRPCRHRGRPRPGDAVPGDRAALAAFTGVQRRFQVRVRPAASSWSTTTGTTRRRSAPPWRPPAGASAAVWSSPSSRTGTAAPSTCTTSSSPRSRTPTCR